MGPHVNLRLVGDINGAGHPEGLNFLLDKIRPSIQGADILFGTLGFPITDRGQFDSSKHYTKARSLKPEDAKALSESGFNCLSLANNHIMDFGGEGLLQTIELLDAQGVKHGGAGRNIEAARSPVILERNGVRVAFLCYTSVYAPTFPATAERAGVAIVRVNASYKPHPKVFEQPGTPMIVTTSAVAEDLDEVREDIGRARKLADVVVVSWHWGVSQGYGKRVSYQTECGRAAIDAGAALVVGVHPHQLQGIEAYGNGAIIYCMGTFTLWKNWVSADWINDSNSLIIDCEIGKAGLESLVLRPVRFNSIQQPEICAEQLEDRLRSLVKDSAVLGTAFRREQETLLLQLKA